MYRHIGVRCVTLILLIVTYLQSLSIICALTFHSMPKFKDSGSKPDLYEVMTIQTQRGKRITHAPVKDSLTLSTPSPGTSPSKKRAWSSEVVENDNYDNITTDQILKRSRNTGKVSVKIHGC